MARQSLAAIPPVAAAVLAMRQRTLTEAARWLASSRKSTGWRGDGVADDVGAAMLGRSSPVTERLLDPQVATVQGTTTEATVFDAVIPLVRLVRRWKAVLVARVRLARSSFRLVSLAVLVARRPPSMRLLVVNNIPSPSDVSLFTAVARHPGV